VGLGAAVFTRYEFALGAAQLTTALVVIVLAGTMHAVVGHLQFLHRGHTATPVSRRCAPSR